MNNELEELTTEELEELLKEQAMCGIELALRGVCIRCEYFKYCDSAIKLCKIYKDAIKKQELWKKMQAEKR